MLSLNMEGFLIKWSCNMHVICVWEWFPLSRKSDPVWQAAGSSIGCCCRLVRKEKSNVIVVTDSWRWHEERTARRSFPKFRRHQKRACCCWVSGCKPNQQAEQKFIFCVYYVDNTFRKVWNLFLIEEKMTVITGWPRHRENREFGSYFFQTGKTQGILLWHREKFWDTGKIFFCDTWKNLDTGKIFGLWLLK